jgi:esterase/lipase superfamily enzyme
MNERYIKWYTPYLSREFEMLAFGNGGGLPLILFPTSFGSYSQNKDFGLVGSVSGYVDSGQVTVYCPDAIDLESFYNKSIRPADRMRTHNAYENVIVRDVFDLARRECNSHRVAVCGASLGAYHAANIAFRHPDTVSHLISLSGSFDISSFFDGYHDDNIYFNSPYEYLPNITDPWKYNHMGFILGSGEWDNTRHESLRLSEILNSKGIPLGSMTGNGAATNGVTGATCCRIICRSCEFPRAPFPSSRAKSRDPVALSTGCSTGFLDYASLRSE